MRVARVATCWDAGAGRTHVRLGERYPRPSDDSTVPVVSLKEAFGDYAVRMNSIPRYVASKTLTEVAWNATLVTTSSAPLKEQPGGDILKVGTGGTFSQTLLEHRLVDEYLFWLFPVIAGSGARLYDGIDPTEFDLVDVRRLDNGVLGLTYVPAGG